MNYSSPGFAGGGVPASPDAGRTRSMYSTMTVNFESGFATMGAAVAGFPVTAFDAGAALVVSTMDAAPEVATLLKAEFARLATEAVGAS